MNNLYDILEAEIKNLYALEKQTIEALDALENSADHKKLVKRMNKMRKKSDKHFKLIHTHLKKKNINPGNVTDSILQEISENLKEITNQEFSSGTKDVSLWTSLNRLMAYKVACYENAYEIATKLDDSKLAKALKKCVKQSKKELDKLFGKTKKHILNSAMA